MSCNCGHHCSCEEPSHHYGQDEWVYKDCAKAYTFKQIVSIESLPPNAIGYADTFYRLPNNTLYMKSYDGNSWVKIH